LETDRIVKEARQQTLLRAGDSKAKRPGSHASTASETKESDLVSWAVDSLMSQMELADALPSGSNRKRLGKSYARGYIFGFIDAVLQKGGLTGETQAIALISVAHVKLFGIDTGSEFVREALSDQIPGSVFTRGREAGGADVFLSLSNNPERKGPPLKLTNYLTGHDVPTGTE
jgi:hypothetical protein